MTRIKLDGQRKRIKLTQTGRRGPQGIQGEQGIAATVNVGDTATVDPNQPASVVNVGTENDAVLNFEIPQGEKGDVGEGVAYGGQIGQVLRKASDDNYDTEWGSLTPSDANADPAGSAAEAEQNAKNYTDSEVAELDEKKVDKVAGKQLSTEDYTSAEKTKLAGIATSATANQTDAYLLSRDNHTGVQSISTVDGLQSALNTKADLIDGKVPESQLPAATHLVQSVNGKQGTVVLDATDVGADPTGSAATAETNANNYTDTAIEGINPGESIIAGAGLAKDGDTLSLGGTMGEDVVIDTTRSGEGSFGAGLTFRTGYEEGDGGMPVVGQHSQTFSTNEGFDYFYFGGINSSTGLPNYKSSRIHKGPDSITIDTMGVEGNSIEDASRGTLNILRGRVALTADNPLTNAGSTLSIEKQSLTARTDGSPFMASQDADIVTKKYLDENTATIATDLSDHEADTANPHNVTKAQVGLGNVDNTSDANKPVSTAQQSALNAKANASDTVNLTGGQTVAGVKTFSSSPVVPTATTGTQAVNKGQMDSADALKVNKAGDTMTGTLAINAGINLELSNGGTTTRLAGNNGDFTVVATSAGVWRLRRTSSGLWIGNNSSAISPAQMLHVDGNAHINGVDYITGTGFPNGVVSATVGSIYIDTAATDGYTHYFKRVGTGNTGWDAVPVTSGVPKITASPTQPTTMALGEIWIPV